MYMYIYMILKERALECPYQEQILPSPTKK